ncbi:hypothetical protein [Eubacterium sp. CAG:161]|uniref:hypothetical protein n=1 Tax=Eubacterium sp. CAG:161 TaxID=1262881 RepID=UPI00033C77C9|nr:hypothetical protein [Eubacterium sp. CAG:161]CCY69768.1 putative uncharacterized protein [Eubacterium sp. CAG:161]
MITVEIDELTPCLKDTSTGAIIETEVIRIKRASFLKNYNKRTGWYTNWAELLKENEVYALVIKGTVDIQGLVALYPSKDMQAVFVTWMCTAPINNKQLGNIPKYAGVGGHLFAIAADKSLQCGFGGALTGFAANIDLAKHYCDTFKAEHIGMLHEYQIFIDEGPAQELMEVYDYEWTDEEI